MKLLILIKKICNGSTYAVNEDIVGKFLELLYSALLVRGNDFSSLLKYIEASEHRYCILEEARFGVANPKFRDAQMKELEDYRQYTSKLYIDLNGQKVAKPDSTRDDIIEARKKALTDVFRVRLYAR